MVIGSSADRVCNCMKYAVSHEQIGQRSEIFQISILLFSQNIPSVFWAFSQALGPPRTSSRSFSFGKILLLTWK